MAIFFFAPIFQMISFGIIIFTMFFRAFGYNYYSVINIFYENKMISILLGYIVSIILSLIVVFVDKKKIKNVFKGIFTLSFFMLTWIPINIVCISKKEFIWEPIIHNRNVDINSVV